MRLSRKFSLLLVCLCWIAAGYWMLFAPIQEKWRMTAPYPEDLQDWNWSPPPLTPAEEEVIEQALNQPFDYLAEGGQSYVFVSQDRQYVLKLFKFHRLTPYPYISYLPDGFLGIKEAHIKKKAKKLWALMEGHRIAFELNKQESGLLYVQLKPGGIDRQVVVSDKNGNRFPIVLSNTAFVVQKKGIPLEEVFACHLERGEIGEIQCKRDQVLALLSEELRKGIYDADHGILHNLGFAAGSPLHLDVGNLTWAPEGLSPDFQRSELERARKKMDQWLERQTSEH